VDAPGRRVATILFAVENSDPNLIKRVGRYLRRTGATVERQGGACLPFDRLLEALLETIVMTLVSGVIRFAIGLPIGIVLVGKATGGIWENAWVNKIVGAFVNGFRSLPFIILLIALIPLNRLIVGTSIGTAAAIVPLSISGIPYFGRVSEVSLREVDRGLIEAVRAMGARCWCRRRYRASSRVSR
jgi:ABC-type methionine transport system permease subunit